MQYLSPFGLILGIVIQAADATLYSQALSVLDIIILLVFIVLGFVFSAIFSGSEVAFFSLSSHQNELEDDDAKRSPDYLIKRMLKRPQRLLATILIGNTFANIICSVLAAVLTGYLATSLGLTGFIVFAIEVVALTFALLIISEITPKVMAINNPLKSARSLSKIIYIFFILFKPMAKLMADSTSILEKKLPRPTNKMTSEDIKTMAEVSEQEGSLRSEEREIIENVIEFGTTTVREIMTSRTDIVAIAGNQPLQEVLTLIRKKGLSRMPVYKDDLDTILGVIHSKDALPYIHAEGKPTTISWRRIARKALFIPATKKLDDLLRDFQQEKTHMAIVVDEYGGTEGVVTLDDILEEIVGEIADENTGDEEALFRKFKNGVYLFDAKIDLDEMEDILDCEITSREDDFETLGGLVYHLTERIPNVGERVQYKGLELTVHSVKNNRVRKLRVKVDNEKIISQETPSNN